MTSLEEEALPDAFLDFFAERAQVRVIERLAGRTLDERYVIEALIGRGGFGVVYRARDLRLERDVAIKLMGPQTFGARFSRVPVSVALDFAREAQTSAALRHPLTVTVYDVSAVESLDDSGAELISTPYIVSEWVDGVPLRSVATADRILAALADVAEALAYAHARGVIHRDLKPENVLVDEAGHARVLDFGLAHSLGRALQTPIAGTPGYMAPEQWRGEPQDARTDVFALGVVAYELLTGARPFADDVDPTGAPRPARLIARRPQASPVLDELIGRCLAIAPDERPESALVVARTLRAVSQRPARNHDAAPACPFPGLRAFTAADASSFFGRDAEVALAFERLAASGRRWLAVEGPSGVGKSSFVAAGVLPLLAHGALGVVTDAPVVIRPGADPVAALREVLARRPTILVIDQLEEVVTLGGAPEGLGEFVSAIAAYLDEANGAWLVTSARSDLLGRLALVPGFAERMNADAERFELGPLRTDGVRRAVTAPALLAGWPLPEDTVARFVAEAARGASLPMIAYALHRLWTTSDGRCSVEDYEAMGGPTVAFVEAADRVLHDLGEEGERRARRVLIGLVDLDGDAVTRRLRPREEAERLAGGDDLARRVLNALGAGPAGLVVGRVEGSTPVVELAHERLCTDWPRLRGWLAERRHTLRARQDLESAAVAWAAAGRPDEGLARGRQLAYLSTSEDASDAAHAYLAASERARRRAEDEAASQRRRRAVMLAAVASGVAALLTWVVVERAQQAEVEERAMRVAKRLVAEAGASPEDREDIRRTLAQSSADLVEGIDGDRVEGLKVDAIVRRASLANQHGEVDEANRLIRDAYRRAIALVDAAPEDREPMLRLADVIDEFIWIGRADVAQVRAAVEDSVERFSKLYAARTTDTEIAQTYTDQLLNLVRYHRDLGNTTKGLAALDRATEVARRAGADDRRLSHLLLMRVRLHRRLGETAEAIAYHALGCNLHRTKGDGLRMLRAELWRAVDLADVHTGAGNVDEAAKALEIAESMARRSIERFGDVELYKQHLVNVRLRQAELFVEHGRRRLAHEAAMESVAITTRVEPEGFTHDVARTAWRLGAAALANGDLTAALVLLEPVAIHARAPKPYPDRAPMAVRVSLLYARALEAVGRFDEADDWFAQAHEEGEELLGIDREAGQARADWAHAAGALARARSDRALLVRVNEVWAKLVEEHPDNAQWWKDWQNAPAQDEGH
ncbi:MAG: protein kinase [Deltaproteobacteria bacterium]